MAIPDNDSAGFAIFIGVTLRDDNETEEIAVRREWVIIALALLVAAFTIVGIVRWASLSASQHTQQVDGPPDLANITVVVSGAVVNPGIYKMRPTDTLHELIVAAGGFAEGADIANTDLSLPLNYGGKKFDVPFLPDYQKPIKPPKAENVEFPININTADASTLQALPGIGPATAERIIAYRETNGPFQKNSEIMNVEGIGEQTYENLLGLITTGNDSIWD